MTNGQAKPRVLLIEDNPADVTLLRLGLDARPEFGHELLVVRDGEEALEFLHRRGRHASAPVPDLILLDLNLPRRHGLEVLSSIKTTAVLRRVPVVVLTSSMAPTDVNSAYDTGANAYVSKPRDLDGTFELARIIEEHWLGLAVRPSLGA